MVHKGGLFLVLAVFCLPPHALFLDVARALSLLNALRAHEPLHAAIALLHVRFGPKALLLVNVHGRLFHDLKRLVNYVTGVLCVLKLRS